MSPVKAVHDNDGLIDKAEALAYSARGSGSWPDQDKPRFRALIRAYIEARHVDDDARAAELEQVLRQCVYGGVPVVMAAASLGVKIGE